MTARIIGNGGENVTPQVTAQTSLIEQMSAALNNGDGAPDFIPQYPMTEDLIPSAIDTDGSIYNGIGYLDDHRWSGSTSSIVATTGYYITGYIPFTNDDILYCKPSGKHTYLAQYIMAFDSSFKLLGSMLSSTLSDGWNIGSTFHNIVPFIRYDNVAYIQITGQKGSYGIPTIHKAIK